MYFISLVGGMAIRTQQSRMRKATGDGLEKQVDSMSERVQMGST